MLYPNNKNTSCSDTIQFIPTYISFPETNIDDHIRKTLQDLTQLLYSKSKPIPAQITDTSKKALLDIANLLNRDNADIKNIPIPTSEGAVSNTKPSTTLTNSKKIKPQPMSNEEFDKLLQSIPTRPTSTLIQQKEIVSLPPVPPPKQTMMYVIPAPKQSSISKPRINRYTYSVPTKHDIAISLVTQNISKKKSYG